MEVDGGAAVFGVFDGHGGKEVLSTLRDTSCNYSPRTRGTKLATTKQP